MAAGTQLIEEVECVARMARALRGELSRFGKSQLINRLLACVELVSLFRPTWVTKSPWPSTQMERIDFFQTLLNQQIETWHPRCGSVQRPNGIQIQHGPRTLTDDLVELERRWEGYLDSNQVLDFATVQKRFLKVQPIIRDKLRHVFVDEYQDNNPIQFAIHAGWLENPETRLTVVGDDDQALYRFRGSDLSCFSDLEPYCAARNIPYRHEKLEENHRSTRAIVSFSQSFRDRSVLHKTSMPKKVHAPDGTPAGVPVRLLRGPWDSLCRCVASELSAAGCGQVPGPGAVLPPTASVLMFSTSERSDVSAALAMRRALEDKRIRVYNPRNKTAADKGSPVYELLGLISYLIDPVTKARAGKGGRMVMVAASMSDIGKAALALSDVPRDDKGQTFPISDAHLIYQKGFMKMDGDIGSPGPITAPFLSYLDDVRGTLLTATEARRADNEKSPPRLTLAGLVARLLSFPRYRNSGFTENLFRQALFTTLLEAHTAPTRRTFNPLDAPLEVRSDAAGKYVWPARYWSFLNLFGSYLQNAGLDNPEVEAFEEHAVLLLTFHQAKGLEFDRVYVAGTGRPVDESPVLRTKLFSGDAPAYRVDPGTGAVYTIDPEVRLLAQADREREVYVALTRPKSTLTILFDPSHEREFLALNPAIESLFKGKAARKYPRFSDIEVKECAP